MKHNEDVVYFK